MTHPESCTDPNCTLTYREHLLSVAVSGVALPTRNPRIAEVARTEKRWERDHGAFERLTHQGYDVPHLDGAAARERHATTDWDIENGHVEVDYSDPN